LSHFQLLRSVGKGAFGKVSNKIPKKIKKKNFFSDLLKIEDLQTTYINIIMLIIICYNLYYILKNLGKGRTTQGK